MLYTDIELMIYQDLFILETKTNALLRTQHKEDTITQWWFSVSPNTTYAGILVFYVMFLRCLNL